jgi:murein DD-endopeptidase MepM/ murein hydrolase activator NlpD
MKQSLLILSLIFFSTPGFAKKLYKFLDENGTVNFSDQPPHSIVPVEIRQLKAEKKRHVWIEQSGTQQHPEYSIRNTYFGPIEVEVALTDPENIDVNPELTKRLIVKPGVSEKLFEMGSVNVSTNLALQYRYVLGSSMAVHDDSVVYLAPFAPGEEFPISQAFHGEFSHNDAQNQYAVDIVMPIGTPIHAARKGVVMDVENDFYKGGTDNKAYKSRANRIIILHKDGSMAVYAHLQLEKSQVYPGMKVNAGQLIGFSGNTGFTTGPHLHFAVLINEDMTLVSVPFFLNDQGMAGEPIVGSFLYNAKGQFFEHEN